MENLEFLKKIIKGKNFGEELYPALEKNIQEGVKSFQLPFKTEINKLAFEAKLNFNKASTSDMYFFNGYDATLTRSNGQEIKQSFEIKKGTGMTVKEAFNQLQGRAVLKNMKDENGEPFMEWSRLNFKKTDEKGNYLVERYNENRGYDLKEALSKFPVIELDGGDKEKDLLRSLERGNAQSATIDNNGEPIKVFFEANPEYKTVNVYDNHFKLLKHDDLPVVKRTQNDAKQDVAEQPKNSQQQAQKQADGKAQKNGRERKPRVKIA